MKWKLEITKVTKSEQNMIVDVIDKDYRKMCWKGCWIIELIGEKREIGKSNGEKEERVRKSFLKIMSERGRQSVFCIYKKERGNMIV